MAYKDWGETLFHHFNTGDKDENYFKADHEIENLRNVIDYFRDTNPANKTLVFLRNCIVYLQFLMRSYVPSDLGFDPTFPVVENVTLDPPLHGNLELLESELRFASRLLSQDCFQFVAWVWLGDEINHAVHALARARPLTPPMDRMD